MTEFTTLEVAKRCPRCDFPGKSQGSRRAGSDDNAPRGSKLHTFGCENSRCSWFQTNWIVQENPDGTIPMRVDEPRRPKQFPVDRALVDQVRKRVEADHQRSIELGKHGRPTSTAR